MWTAVSDLGRLEDNVVAFLTDKPFIALHCDDDIAVIETASNLAHCEFSLSREARYRASLIGLDNGHLVAAALPGSLARDACPMTTVVGVSGLGRGDGSAVQAHGHDTCLACIVDNG